MGIRKLEHVGVQVKDIEASIQFYQDIVGLQLLDQFPHTDSALQLAFLGLDNQIIVELIEGYNPDLPSEGKVHHIAFTVDNITLERERLKSLGVQFVDETITTLPNGAQYLFFYGPDGEWIEYFEPKQK
ncbi:VOC family protein [Metabacillus iocasae]|uniref:Lactoylglutathione lyase n=1 Tax=Priestia iocasae TaxID=2291674 RepID=A0ABS2QYU1_9BACI|nr:VOC family protein [Metabacillus iocasae]MBM7704655.1 lactoylglutathione lyase [Metabacillus iocasae]